VHRLPFEQSSEVFRDMLEMPTPEGEPLDGSSDDKPLHLSGIKEGDFRALLKAMFPLLVRLFFQTFYHDRLATRHFDADQITWSEWTSILRLSRRFCMADLNTLAIGKVIDIPQCRDEWIDVLDFSTTINGLGIPKIRESAIQAISKLSTDEVDKVLLGRDYMVTDWLLEGYMTLVQRKTTISQEEEDKLGMKATLELLRVRDHVNWECTCRANGSYSRRGAWMSNGLIRGPLCFKLCDLEGKIRSCFADEFAKIADPDLIVPKGYLQPASCTPSPGGSVTRDEIFYFATETFLVGDI
jgi:hypothetical protein